MSDDDRGDSLASRLMSRQSAPGLHRVSMPDGGEAYSGPLAQRALRTLGARAFTVDRSVILSRSFDRNNPEDMALYAHERFHQREAQGKAEEAENGASHGGRDAEEIAARAIERMVVHRARSGEDFGSVMRSVNSGEMDDQAKGGGGPGGEGEGEGGDDPNKPKVSKALIGGNKDRDPMEGYKALMKDGRTHWQIVNELKDHVVRTLERISDEHSFRSTRHDFFG